MFLAPVGTGAPEILERVDRDIEGMYRRWLFDGTVSV